jgi:cytoskeletal protein RodZ
MLARIRRLPSPALVLSAIALVVAVGGGSIALATSATNRDKRIAKRVANQQIKRKAPALSVNHAKSADNATHAASADNATNADNAMSADNATHAMNADHANKADDAISANNADNADHANNADHATNADNATSAQQAANATNADELDNLDSSQFLRTSSRGVALAGARVTGTGTVLSFFNRSGGAPTVTHTANSGDYTLSFPGISININFEIVQATLLGDPGESTVDSVNGNAIVDTFNSAGAASDRQFDVVVFGGGPTG